MEYSGSEQSISKAKKQLDLIIYRDNSNKTYNLFVCSQNKGHAERCSKLIGDYSNLRLVRVYKKVKGEIVDELADKIDEELNKGWIDLQDLDDIFLRDLAEVYQKLYKDAKS